MAAENVSHHIWLRAESKENERRAALTPDACKTLLTTEPKCKVTVERSKQRIFPDDEYETVGCEMVDEGAWESAAPPDAYIVGIKELPEDTKPLKHTHVYFAHCYKNQGGWEELLTRFKTGGGLILDVEYMVDDNGKRAVAAFGPVAGFCGAAVGLDVWSHQSLDPTEKYAALSYFPSSEDLVSSIKDKVQKVLGNKGLDTNDDSSYPRVMVIGALGRCGKGAIDAIERIGIPESRITKWDIEETPKTGPVKELLNYNILVNCIFLDPSVESPPLFVNKELLTDAGKDRELTVVVDVSCDTSNPNNPLPIYTEITTFESPTIRLPENEGEPVLDVVAIDHLPSLLPKESSLAFSEKLLPFIQDLPNVDSNEVLKNSKKEFLRHSEKVGGTSSKPEKKHCVVL